MEHLVVGHGVSVRFGTSLSPTEIDAGLFFWGESKCASVWLSQCMNTRRDPTVCGQNTPVEAFQTLLGIFTQKALLALPELVNWSNRRRILFASRERE
jgi:hypothetical protein